MTGKGGGLFARRFSPERYERSYDRAAGRALATVPYYRESWEAGRRQGIAPGHLPAGDVPLHLPRLYPLARPPHPAGDPAHRSEELHELHEALLITSAYDPARTLFDIRPALVEPCRLGPGRTSRYQVVLSADAIVDPFLPAEEDPRRRSVEAFLACANPALLGTAAEIGWLLDAHGGRGRGERIFLRRPLSEAAHAAEEGAVLHDPHLGYVGGWAPSCDLPHVNWRRYHAASTPDGVVFTKLHQLRPTLVRFLPEAAAGLVVDACPRHGTPVLRER